MKPAHLVFAFFIAILAVLFSSTAIASTMPDHVLRFEAWGNDNPDALRNASNIGARDGYINSSLFTSSGVPDTGNYGMLVMHFDTPALITQICWTNLTFDSDYIRGAGLYYDSTDDYGNYVSVGSNGGFGANASVCVYGSGTTYSKYWKVIQTSPQQWRRWANVTVTLTFQSAATATPTVTQTPEATVQPTGFLPLNICLTASPVVSATIQATPTPYGNKSPTPAPTRTPGGPTATPTPSPTGSAITTTAASKWEAYDWSSTADFSQGLQPWTAGNYQACEGCVMSRTQQSLALTGPDSLPGVAIVGKGVEYYQMVSHWGADVPWNAGWADPANNYGHWQDTLVLALPQAVTRPINITGYARTLHDMQPGNTAWLYVWYLDPGTTDPATLGPAWLSLPAYRVQIPQSWSTWGVRITPSTYGYPKEWGSSAQAIAISWVVENDANSSSESTDTQGNAMLLDDMKITIGDTADALLPICGPDGKPSGQLSGGGGTYGINVPQKICQIAYNDIDVLSTCVAPTDWTNIGGWTNWVWCRISRYFQFLKENQQQAAALQQRQNTNEPIGSLSELGDVTGAFIGTLAQMQALNRPAAQSPLNFVSLFNVSALDHPQLDLHVPTNDMSFMASCPAEIVSRGQQFSYGACWAISALRQTVAVQLMQWFLNAVFIIGLIRYIYGVIKDIAS